MLTNTTIIGAGGHAKVVADVLSVLGVKEYYIVDSAQNKVGTIVQHKKVTYLGKTLPTDKFHIAVGLNQVRFDLYCQYVNDAQFVSIISPDAYIASSAKVYDGVFVAAKAVVSAESHIGKGCIINHGAIVEHDCNLGEFCHVSPSAALLGGVNLGDRVFVGAGAIVLPGVRVTSDVIIGAGAVVTCDILEKCTLVGIPAKII